MSLPEDSRDDVGREHMAIESWSFQESIVQDLYIVVYSAGLTFGYNSISCRELVKLRKYTSASTDSDLEVCFYFSLLCRSLHKYYNLLCVYL